MISQLINYLNRQKTVMQTFSQSINYLEDGVYNIDNSVKGISRDDYETKQFVESKLKNKNSKENYLYIKSMLQILFVRKNLKVASEKKFPEFQGSIFLPSNNGSSDVKIFDLVNKKVLTMYSNERNYRNKVDTYSEFKSFFKMPKIIYKDEGKKILIEEMIEFTAESEWDQEGYLEVFKSVLNQYERYGENIKKAKRLKSFKIDYLANQSNYAEQYRTHFLDWGKKEILKWSFPLVQVHGDMWSGNILLENNSSDIYIIDWDTSNEQFFFNDIFWFISYEYIQMNNDFLIDCYFEGSFDDLLSEFFTIFGAEYKADNKIHYLKTAFFFSLAAKEIDSKEMDENLQLFNKKIECKLKVSQ